MTDPIAEAAAQQAQAQIAAAEQQAAPSLLDQAIETISPAADLGNAAEGAAPSSVASGETPSSAPAVEEPEVQAAGGEDPNANPQWTSEQLAAIKEAAQPLTLNTIAAPAAASQPESVISSSVSDVSHAVDTLEASASADRERARVAIDHLRAHLWTFTGDSVAKLHAELDKIEAFFK